VENKHVLNSLYVQNLWTNQFDDSPKESGNRDPNIIHNQIYCSKCNHPVIGCRFYCTGCSDYNLCEACEAVTEHSDHYFLKIRYALPQPKPNLGIQLKLPENTRGRNELISSGSSIRKPKMIQNDKKDNTTVNIRNMVPADIDQVYAIEKESFFTPYSYEFFLDFQDKENGFIFVGEKPDKLIGGYIAFNIQKSKIQLVSIAVALHSRRMGVAQQLITAMMRMCYEININQVFLHVSIYNYPAQKLYQSFGFVNTKWIKNYYTDQKEDAIIMVHNNIAGHLGLPLPNPQASSGSSCSMI
jgi:ribosomal-protein-alanine N-acetyltransferase